MFKGSGKHFRFISCLAVISNFNQNAACLICWRPGMRGEKSSVSSCLSLFASTPLWAIKKGGVPIIQKNAFELTNKQIKNCPLPVKSLCVGTRKVAGNQILDRLGWIFTRKARRKVDVRQIQIFASFYVERGPSVNLATICCQNEVHAQCVFARYPSVHHDHILLISWP